jgi:hypothetical protein
MILAALARMQFVANEEIGLKRPIKGYRGKPFIEADFGKAVSVA